MANISLPSWREDQPTSVEQALAPLLDTPGHPLALSTLNAYRADRDVAAANYHDYVRAVNALQQRNIESEQEGKRLEFAGKIAPEIGKTPGVAEFLTSLPLTAGLIGNADVTTGGNYAKYATSAEAAKNVGAYLQGAAAGGNVTAQGDVTQPPIYGMPPVQTFGTGVIPQVAASQARAAGGGSGDQTTLHQVETANGPVTATRDVKLGGGKGGGPVGAPTVGPVRRTGPASGGPTQPDIPLERGQGSQAPQSTVKPPAASATAVIPPEERQQVVSDILSNLSGVPNGSAIERAIKAGIQSGKMPVFNDDGTVTFYGPDGKTFKLRPQR